MLPSSSSPLQFILLCLYAIPTSAPTVEVDSQGRQQAAQQQQETHHISGRPLDACPKDGWDDVADTGFLVLRGAVPATELAHMQEDAYSIPLPGRYLCGASFVRPMGCHRRKQLFAERYPVTQSVIVESFERLGKNAATGFGNEVTIANTEYVSINHWPLAHNSSCVFRAVFDAAAAHMPERAEHHDRDCACPSTAEVRGGSGAITSLRPCFLHCMYEAVKATPAQTLQQVLEPYVRASANAGDGGDGGGGGEGGGEPDGAGDALCAAPNPYPFLDGPVDYFLGSEGMWSSMRNWITNVANVPLANGYHDWHTDGPATNPDGSIRGRFHKVFIMVMKSNGTDAHRTNVRLAPNHAKDVLDARGNPTWKRVRKPIPTWFDSARDPGPGTGGRTAGGRRPIPFGALPKTWYLRDDWDDIEHSACDVPMLPGDVLITRQDVWHRTQDVDQDRMLLKVDMFRPPLESDLERATASEPRMHL